MNLQLFTYESKDIRTVIINGEPWWVLKDVCDVLEIGNPSDVAKRLDDDEKNTLDLIEGIGNPIKTIINEPGLYSVIIRSDKPEAKKFKRWITHEVIPQIRKTGSYSSTSSASYLITDPVKRARAWADEQERLQIAQQQTEELRDQIEVETPYTDLGRALANIDDAIGFSEVSRIICQDYPKFKNDWGRTKLMDFLRLKGHLQKTGTNFNIPTQRYAYCGYYRVVSSILPTGKTILETRVLPDGLIEIKNLVEEEVSRPKDKRQRDKYIRTNDLFGGFPKHL